MYSSSTKLMLVCIVLAGFVPAFYGAASGDRWFAVGLWLVFTLITGTVIVLIPMLRCPECGRETNYFHNYSETVANRRYRFTKCRGCHAMIDRMSCEVVAGIDPDDGQTIDRISVLMQGAILFVFTGVCLIIISVTIGVITTLLVTEGRANPNRTVLVFVGSGVGLLLGMMLIVAPFFALRRSRRRLGLGAVLESEFTRSRNEE